MESNSLANRTRLSVSAVKEEVHASNILDELDVGEWVQLADHPDSVTLS